MPAARYGVRMERRRQIRLPAAMDAMLVELARQHGVSVSDLVREAVTRVYVLPQVAPLRPVTPAAEPVAGGGGDVRPVY